MALVDLTRALAQSLGMADFEPCPSGDVRITVDGDYMIEVTPAPSGPDMDEPGFLITATVGPVPADGREAAFAELLEANLEGRGTGGNSLSIDPRRDEIVLCRCCRRQDMPFGMFEAEFAAFVEAFEFWRARHVDGRIGSGQRPDEVPGSCAEPDEDRFDPSVIRG